MNMLRGAALLVCTILISLFLLIALATFTPLRNTVLGQIFSVTPLSVNPDPHPTEQPPTPTSRIPYTATQPPPVVSIYPSLHVATVVRNLGDQAGSGQEQWRGFEVAEEYFKERGIDIDLQLNGSGSITKTIEIFEKLGQDDAVLAIAGPTFSSEAKVAVRYVMTAGIPVLGISNTQGDLIGLFESEKLTNYVRVSAPVDEFTPYALREAFEQSSRDRKVKIRNIAIVYDGNNSFTVSEAMAYQNYIADYSGTEVVTTTFITGDEVFISQITSILTPTLSEDPRTFPNSLPPDLVIVSGLIREGGMFVQQLKEQGYSGLIIGGNGLNAPDITDHCHIYCSGLIVAQSYDYRLDSEGNEEFIKRYRAKYDLTDQDYPTQFAAQAFASVQVIVQALEKLDNQEKNRENGTRIKDMPLDNLQLKLNEILHSGEQFSTVVGNIKITTQGEVEQHDFASSIFQEGKFIITK